MEENRLKLRKNLRLMYRANAILAVSMLVALIPVINLLAVLAAVVASVMEIVGVVRLRTVHRRYQDAVSLLAIGFLLGLLPSNGLAKMVLDVIQALLALAQFYCVISATNDMLKQENCDELVEKGQGLWKLTMVITGIQVASIILEFGFDDNWILALVFMLVTLIVSLVKLERYVDYLEKSSKVFEQ